MDEVLTAEFLSKVGSSTTSKNFKKLITLALRSFSQN